MAWAMSKLAKLHPGHPLVAGSIEEPTGGDPHANVPGYQEVMRGLRNQNRRGLGLPEVVDE